MWYILKNKIIILCLRNCWAEDPGSFFFIFSSCYASFALLWGVTYKACRVQRELTATPHVFVQADPIAESVVRIFLSAYTWEADLETISVPPPILHEFKNINGETTSVENYFFSS